MTCHPLNCHRAWPQNKPSVFFATATSLREHVYRIKKHGLYQAVDCTSFKQYCELGRIEYGGEKIKLGYVRLKELAANGEVEQHIPKDGAPSFSDRAYTALSRLRIEYKDAVTGEVTSRSHDIDTKKVKAVIDQLLKDQSRAVGNGKSDAQITARDVQSTIDRKFGAKPPKTMAATLDAYTTRATKELHSFESALELNDFIFSDSDEESAGCAKRLATAYSKLASFLRKV